MDAAGRFRWRRDVQVITAIEFRGEGGGWRMWKINDISFFFSNSGLPSLKRDLLSGYKYRRM